jgi:ABC-2 type transport system ATP-binding protein
MSAHAIEIRGLHKKFGTFTLGPLDLTVPEGAVYGFVGPNGAGKTTTINLIMGMGAADAGAISVHGCDHARDDLAMKRLVGYASPELNFRPWGRVGRVIRFVRGFYPSWDQKYCGHLLETFSVGADERISALSLGARTKLALVLAMSWRPRVLVLDEPTVGLDPIARRQLFAELLAAVQDEGRTVFISSHSVSDLERFADHIGMIKQGRLVLEGSTADITERFRMLDFVTGAEASVDRVPGLVVQRREARRYRALLDRRAASLDAVRALGVTELSDVPVSLEDVFIALGHA